MKIAKIFYSVQGALPVPTEGVVQFGPFLPASMAQELSPYMLVEVPLQRRVTAVVVILPQREGAFYFSMQFVDFTNAEEKGTMPDLPGYPENALLPEHGVLMDNPPIWLRLILKQSQKYWEPLTSKMAASKIAPVLHTMTVEERKELLNDNRTAVGRITKENVFICMRWPVWAKHELSFEECAEDAQKHGLDLDAGNIRKRAGRLGLPSLKDMVK